MAFKRLRHNKQLNDEVIDSYLAEICTQDRSIKSSAIPSLYTERFMGDDFNYISDTRHLHNSEEEVYWRRTWSCYR